MPESKEYTSRRVALAYQVEDPSEVVITDTGRQTAYNGDYVVTETRGNFSYTYILSPDMLHEEWVEKGQTTDINEAKRNDEFASDPTDDEDTGANSIAPPVTQVSPSDPALSPDTQANPASAQNAGAVESSTPQEATAPAPMGSAGSEVTGTDEANDAPQEITTETQPNETVTSVPDSDSSEANETDPAPAVSSETDNAANNPDSPTSANVADVMPSVGENMETSGPTDVNSDASATPDENATAAETPSDESTTTNGPTKRTLMASNDTADDSNVQKGSE